MSIEFRGPYNGENLYTWQMRQTYRDIARDLQFQVGNLPNHDPPWIRPKDGGMTRGKNREIGTFFTGICFLLVDRVELSCFFSLKKELTSQRNSQGSSSKGLL